MSSTAQLSDSDHAGEEAYLRRVRPVAWQNPAPKRLYDLAVLGAGPAGLAAVDSAVRQGLRVALIERYRLGGNSLNTGSIPSKAILRSARAAAVMREGEAWGAAVLPQATMDFAAVMARMRAIRTRIAEYHSVDRLCADGVDVFFGAGGFTGPHELRVGEAHLSFQKAIIATGAKPRPSTIPGLGEIGYFTSESIFNITALPRRLGIIGGGPLGCELAQAFCRLGAHVSILQNDPQFLPQEERDAAELLSLSLSRDGVETRLNTTVVGVRSDGQQKWLDTVNNEIKSSFPVDDILLSIGRVPNVDDLNLAAANIEGAGGLTVEDCLRTTNPDVYAAGDVCKAYRFANIAEATGRMAALNAFAGDRERQSHLMIPSCTYCDPEIARLGMNVLQARQRSISATSFTIMMQDVDRAITDGQDGGFVKIYVRDGTDEIIGATIVAARASEMINELAVIMSAKVGMRQLSGILHSYPAQSDAIRLAAIAYVKSQPALLWRDAPAGAART
jgi:pyruvate/2-oxoglutarate dehydrogenase complex dihydrolipoamide dehydrogenase (E3) component